MLVDPEQVANRLGIGDDQIGAVATAVQIVSQRVASYVGWHLSRARDENGDFIGRWVPVYGTRGTILDTGLRPLWRVDAIALDDTLLGLDEYRYRRDGKLYRAHGWGDPFTVVSLFADVGYGYTPADIESVVVSASARWLANPIALRSTSASDTGTDDLEAGESRTFAGPPDAFTIGERVILDKYRRTLWP